MFSKNLNILALLSLAAFSAAAPATDLESRDNLKCHDGPFMIVAHGTSQTGEGSLTGIADGVQAQIPNAGSTGFKYPSEIPHYPKSESTGVKHMKSHIRNYINKCGKKSKVMLLGYSQGAQIVSDIMGGGTYIQFPNQPDKVAQPLEDEYRKHIIAVLQFGDPAFTIGHKWDAGTSTKSGQFPRTQEQINHIKKYSHMMRSYCDKGDPYCAQGKKNDKGFTVHGAYFGKYDEQAINFLVKQWNQSKH